VTFTEIAFDTYDIATLNAQALDNSDKAYDHILSAAKQQQQIAAIREEQLQIVRRDAFIDVWFRNILIAVGVVAAIL